MSTNTPNPEQFKQLCELFPEADEEVCRAVYDSHNGDLESSINAMLSITDPNYIPDEVPPVAETLAPQPEQTATEDLTSVITSTSEQQLKADEDLARALMAEEERQATQTQQPNRPPLPPRRSSSNDVDPTLQEIKEKINVFTDNTVKKIKELYNRYLMPEYEDLYGQQMPSPSQYEQNTSSLQTGAQDQDVTGNYNESSRYNHHDFLEDPDDMRSASIINTPFQKSTPPPPPPRNNPDITGFAPVSTEGAELNEQKDDSNSSLPETVSKTAPTNTSISSAPISLPSTAEPVSSSSPTEAPAITAPSSKSAEMNNVTSSFSAPEASAIIAPTIPSLPEENDISLDAISEPVLSSTPEKLSFTASDIPVLSQEDSKPIEPIDIPSEPVSPVLVSDQEASKDVATASINSELSELATSTDQISSIAEEFSKTKIAPLELENPFDDEAKQH